MFNAFLVQGLYDRTPLEQQYSPLVSELVARLLTTDPERRPSAREILENLTAHEDSLSAQDECLQNISVKRKTTLLVTSIGPWSTDRHGMLGVYKEAGTKNNCPYYQQMDTERKDGAEYVIYRSKRGGWLMGNGLDEPPFLFNASKAKTVPLIAGWVKTSSAVDVPAHILITASVDEEVRWPDCDGDYIPTQMFSLGRRIFKHQTQERYLFVRPLAFNCTAWKVKVSVGDKEAMLAQKIDEIEIEENPADPRAWEWMQGGKVKCNMVELTHDLDLDHDLDLHFYDRTDLFYFELGRPSLKVIGYRPS